MNNMQARHLLTFLCITFLFLALIGAFNPVFRELTIVQVNEKEEVLGLKKPVSVYLHDYVPRPNHDNPRDHFYIVEGRIFALPFSRDIIRFYSDDCPVYMMVNDKKLTLEGVDEQGFCNLRYPTINADAGEALKTGWNNFRFMFVDKNWIHGFDIRFGASPLRMMVEVLIYIVLLSIVIRHVNRYLFSNDTGK